MVSKIDENEKKFFYTTLVNIITSLTSSLKIVLGDFNAKIGHETCYKKVVGNYSLHVNMNDNGSKLIYFCNRKRSGDKKHYVSKKGHSQIYLGISRWKIYSKN